MSTGWQAIISAPTTVDTTWDITRQSARFRVAVPVWSEGSGPGARGIAESLSRSGMFVRGLEARIGTQLSLQLEVEGGLACEARVVHELDDAEADRLGRAVGVGVEFVAGDSAFEAALDRYLSRIEGRAERRLLVLGERPALLLAACGYQVERASEPLANALQAVARPLHALVLPASETLLRTDESMAADLPAVVVAMDSDSDLDSVLPVLDAVLQAPVRRAKGRD